jgi:hypothetical protein
VDSKGLVVARVVVRVEAAVRVVVVVAAVAGAD